MRRINNETIAKHDCVFHGFYACGGHFWSLIFSFSPPSRRRCRCCRCRRRRRRDRRRANALARAALQPRRSRLGLGALGNVPLGGRLGEAARAVRTCDQIVVRLLLPARARRGGGRGHGRRRTAGSGGLGELARRAHGRAQTAALLLPRLATLVLGDQQLASLGGGLQERGRESEREREREREI
jgi:hypothetical protein